VTPKIDRSNYEIWIVDLLDGILDQMQKDMLRQFLDLNPDLKEELAEMAIVKLCPSGKPYLRKDLLKRTASDLSESQFEYLCVAYLENDLDADQQKELFDLTEQDPVKRNTFNLIQKTKLAPYDIKFSKRKLLVKFTPFQSVIRLSVYALSTAAAVFALLILYHLVQISLNEKVHITAQNGIIRNDRTIIPDNPSSEDNSVKREAVHFSNGNNSHTVTCAGSNDLTGIDSPHSVRTPVIDSVSPETEIMRTVPPKVPFNMMTGIGGVKIENELVRCEPALIIPPPDDDRSRIGKFIAKNFRQKILKEENAFDTPLKPFEIAEGGVTMINSLFGWEMSLVKNNDEKGDVSSVLFSSGILKFKAPVNKSRSRSVTF
jgi:hypothetical protein